ncbi:MAG: trimethylamine methyltransferase family protein [archaeon]
MTVRSVSPGPLELLDADGVERIHEASMTILAEQGIQVKHDRACELLADAGATVDDDRQVFIDEDLVSWALGEAPDAFTMVGHTGERTVTVGDDVLRAPGYGPPNVVTHADGRRESTLADYERLVKLAHGAEAINCTGYNLCEPTDVDQSVKHLEMVSRSLQLSDQPLMGSTYGEDRAEECLELVRIATGDDDLGRPYIAGLINTVPPRSLDTKMVGGLLTYAEHGQPTVISSFTMAGASGPATLAGSMAQANAENLLGIVLAQAVTPGAPVVYGVPSSNVDMRYGSLSIGSPESAMFVAFAGQMGRYYGVPSRGGGCLSDAKTVDYQAGFESALVAAVTGFADVDLVLHAAGILESYSAISPEKFLLDCELLTYLDRFEAGFALEDDDFALDVIEAVEPADHYLSHRHTLEHAEAAFLIPELADKRSHSDWADDGGRTAFAVAAEAVDARLEAYQGPTIDAATADELERYVTRRTATRE